MAGTLNEKQVWLTSSPPHAREAWGDDGCNEVLIHVPWPILKGSQEGARVQKKSVAKLYQAAKQQNDMDAAHRLIDAVWNSRVQEILVERVISMGKKPVIVSPHPSFDDDDCIDHDAAERLTSRNAIPFAYASRLKEMLDGYEGAPLILQAARVGRTKLPRFPRFLFQPHFVGDVLTDRPYIIADDTLALGGTMASLYGHIRRSGGTVLAVTALAHMSGSDVRFALTDATLAGLIGRYGVGLMDFWKECVGHELASLTEGEGRFILEWENRHRGDTFEELQRLRARLDRARSTFE